MAGVGIAYMITGGKSIYREQVATKAQSEAHRHEYGKRVLEQIQVSEAMIAKSEVITFSPDDPVEKVCTIIDQTAHTGFPVLDNGRLVGIITVADVRRSVNGAGLSSPVRDAMTRDLIVVSPEDTMENAMRLMMIYNIHHLLVVEPDHPELMVGFLTRTDMMQIYSRACRII